MQEVAGVSYGGEWTKGSVCSLNIDVPSWEFCAASGNEKHRDCAVLQHLLCDDPGPSLCHQQGLESYSVWIF